MFAARHPLSPHARRTLAIVGVAVLLPIGLIPYLVAILWFRGYPISVEPVISTTMVLYVLGLSLTGVLVFLNWNWGLRIAPAAAVGALLVWPLLVHTSIGDVDYGLVAFAIVLIATGLEGVLRFPERLRQLTTGPTGRYALAAGLLHFTLGFGLHVVTRRFFWMEYTFPSSLLMGFIVVLSGLGLVAAGALPVMLWRREQLISPSLVVAGWFLWGLYGTWQLRASLPLGHFWGINWSSLQPYPDYILKWTVLMVVLLAVAGCELAVRQTGRYLDSGDAKSTT